MNDDFEGLFRRVVRAVRRFGRSQEDAEDLAQEAMLRALRSGRQPDDQAAYLIRIADNVAKTQHARAMRRRDPEEPEIIEHRTPLDEAIQRQALADFYARVEEVLDELPDETQHCIVLRRHGYTSDRIAQMLDLSHDSVRSRFKRANKAFVERLGPPPDGYEWLDLAGDIG